MDVSLLRILAQLISNDRIHILRTEAQDLMGAMATRRVREGVNRMLQGRYVCDKTGNHSLQWGEECRFRGDCAFAIFLNLESESNGGSIMLLCAACQIITRISQRKASDWRLVTKGLWSAAQSTNTMTSFQFSRKDRIILNHL